MVVGVINDFFSLQVQDEINKWGNLKVSIPLNDWLRKTPLQKWYRISVNYGISLKRNLMLFDGYLSDFTLRTESIDIEAYNWIHYLQYRLLDRSKKYQSTPIKTIVSEIFEIIKEKGQLPFSLGDNNCDKVIAKEFPQGTSFFDVLRGLNEENPDLIFRIITKNGENLLEVGEKIGDVLQGVRECDTSDPWRTNIVNREWKDSMDEFRNSQGALRNDEHLRQTGLLFERALEDKTPAQLPKSTPLPAITISRDTDWRDFNVGDRKSIRLITGYERLSLSYTGLIQERRIIIGAWGLKSEIKVAQNYREDVNVLDTIIKNLRKTSAPQVTPAPQVDLSWYATSSAVNQAIQSQNTKIEQKADSSFVQWVAQTAQTALNTANEAKQTAESKAPIQHTHNKSEVWLDQVDNTSDEDKPLSKATKKALELKCSFADIVDNLNTEEIKPLSAKQGKVLKGLIDNINRILVSDDTDLDQLQEIVNYIKQNKKILSQLGISNISGLVEALEGKANKVHTHTKSQISDFPTSMPASDVHKRAKQVNKPTYTISEIQGLQEALDNKSSSVASLDRIDFNYTTNLTQKKFRIGSRYQLSNVPHDQGWHQLQVLWWDLQPQGTGHDGGWGLMFWPDQNPYLQMQGEDVAIGRTGGLINPKTRINFPQSVGLKRDANTDGANIYFRSSSNDDSSLDFKLYDDGSEWFRFLYNNTRRVAFNHDLATYKQKFFVHWQVQYGEFPNISLAIWDSDTGFNREADGVLSYFSNGSKLQTIHQNAVPVVAEDFGRNVKMKKLTQAQYDALGAGRPNNVVYYITD